MCEVECGDRCGAWVMGFVESLELSGSRSGLTLVVKSMGVGCHRCPVYLLRQRLGSHFVGRFHVALYGNPVMGRIVKEHSGSV